MNGTREELEAQGWICTDPDCIQYMRVIDSHKFEFMEDRVSDPLTGATEVYYAEIDLNEYSIEDILSDCASFGYGAEEVKTWLHFETELALIAECIFEMSN